MILIRERAVRDIGNSIKVYMFPNEFHKSLTASLMYLQSSRQRLVLFLFSIYFQWFLQTFIILKLSEQKLAFLFFILYSYSVFQFPTMLLQRLPACPVHSVVPSLLHHRLRHYRHFLHWLLLLHLWQLSYLAMP